ncbi:MAG: class I SAM-dependent methyltransferase [Myxococcales bacterium]|nr:class I SAM-dependent methyltransferase [Myxococcales bacterium]
MLAYYKERPEIVRLVPETCRRVLDVGCGSGIVGSAIKRQRPGIEVRGIEPVAEAAAEARAVLDDVYEGYAGDDLPAGWPAPDCLVFADTLEHMPDPWSVLAGMTRRLPPGTVVIVSLPNVMHHAVLADLWKGRWDYRDEGVLDRTHLRFFTRMTAVELIESAGLTVESLDRVANYPGPGLVKHILRMLTWPARAWERRRGTPRRGRSILDPFTLQYLFRARTPDAPE